MTDSEMERMDPPQEERERAADDLLAEQEDKGYGADEGERDEAIESG